MPELPRLQSSIFGLLTRQENALRDQLTLSTGDTPDEILSWLQSLRTHRADLVRGELTVAVVGTMKAGKSTTINAIIGTEVLPSRNGPMTALPTLVRHVPGRRLPVLRFGTRGPFDAAIGVLAGHLQQMRDDGSLSDWSATRGQGFSNLAEALLSGRLTRLEEEYVGADEIRTFLGTLNDVARLAAERGYTIPLEEYGALHRLPVIEVEFHHLPAHRSDLSGGTLTLIDTPGPNEYGQDQFKGIVERQLKNATAVLVVLDYTQLGSQAEADLLASLQDVAGRSGDRLFVAVNKFDQWSANSQDYDEVRRSVAGTFSADRLAPDQVHPLSSRWAFLAHRVLRRLDLNEGLPMGADWLEEFGQAALGTVWEEAIRDETRVRQGAAHLLLQSRFEPFLAQVIRRCVTWAPRMLMSVAAEQMRDFERRLREQATGPQRLEGEVRIRALEVFLESVTSGKGVPRQVAIGHNGILVVSAEGAGDHKEIAAAVAAAPAGATVLVRPGTYRESLVVDKPVIIIADGDPADVVLEGEDAPCLVLRTDGAEVRGLTLRGRTGRGQKPSHAVVVDSGSPVLNGCRITSDSLAAMAVHGKNSAPALQNCYFYGGVQGGLLFADGAGGVADDCLFEGNSVAGVLITGGANPVIRRCHFEAGNERGVLIFQGGQGTVADCDIHSAELAGIEVTGASAPEVERCTIHHGAGAGVLVQDGGTGRFDACDIVQNRLAGFEIRAGANPQLLRCKIRDGLGTGLLVHSGGLGTMVDCVVRSNALAGVSIQSDANPTLRKCRILAGAQGGVLVTDGGRGLLEDCTVSGNEVAGVAIGDGGNPVLRRCRVVDGPRDGLVVYRTGRGVAEKCEFANNQRAGVALQEYAAPVLKQCRLHNNHLYGLLAEESGGGVLHKCHLYQNGEAGALIQTEANPTLQGCELYENGKDGVRTMLSGRGLLQKCNLRRNGHSGVAALQESTPIVRNCLLEDGLAYGLFVAEGARPLIEQCDFHKNAKAGIAVTTNGQPVVRKCQVRAHKEDGISVTEQGQGLFEETRVFGSRGAGLFVSGGGDPVLRHCTLDEGNRDGARVESGGKGLLEECIIAGNTRSGLLARGQGTEPVLRRCQVARNSEYGVHLEGSAGGRIEQCDITANKAAGIGVSTDANPAVIGCTIHDGLSSGVQVFSAGMGSFDECELFANKQAAVVVSEGSDPFFSRCVVRDKYGINVERQGKGRFERCQVLRNETGFHVVEHSNVIIRHCVITHNVYEGINVQQAVIVVEDSTIADQPGKGVHLRQSPKAAFKRCRIHSNGGDGLTTDSSYASVQDCTITDNQGDGIYLDGGEYEVLRCVTTRNSRGLVASNVSGVVSDCNCLGNRNDNVPWPSNLTFKNVEG